MQLFDKWMLIDMRTVTFLLFPLMLSLVVTACGEKEKTSDIASKYNTDDGSVISISSAVTRDFKTVYARQMSLDSSVDVTGLVLANANLLTHVTTPVTGRVTEVMVSIGDRINEGQTLAYVRSPDIEQSEADLLQNEGQIKADLKRDLMQVDSDLSQAAAQLKLSKSTFSRIDALYSDKIAARADYEIAKTNYDKDQITLETNQRKRQTTIVLSNEHMKVTVEPIKQKLRLLGVSESQIEKVLKTRHIDPVVPVPAPESGILSERLVNVGELVDPTKALFTIGDYHNVWVKADIFQKDVALMKEGLPIELEVDSFPGEKFYGKLNYLADSISSDTRTLVVRAEVSNPGLKLKPKMFTRMKILVGQRQTLAIPAEAVQDTGSQKVVYLPMGNNKYIERIVDVGTKYGDYVEIRSGIKSGDQVVTVGSSVLCSKSLQQSG